MYLWYGLGENIISKFGKWEKEGLQRETEKGEMKEEK